ncbi:hypothetical protein CYY_010195 [Polysphondylium violaceum]|uniref:Uncharacterized protein n=1 Tax=Polysphondylium violaceum TaxID=133409 RepID=A0A8J4PL04_9MYCE|nr:hypothetical protein CYY_010195 [Polysphondylium violaceum]
MILENIKSNVVSYQLLKTWVFMLSFMIFVGLKDYNPRNLVPVGMRPQLEEWSRAKFYQTIVKALKRKGYQRTQYSMRGKYCSESQAMEDAYTLHQEPNMEWLPFCIQKLHLVKLVTLENIYVPFDPIDDDTDSDVDIPDDSDIDDSDKDDDDQIGVIINWVKWQNRFQNLIKSQFQDENSLSHCFFT